MNQPVWIRLWTVWAIIGAVWIIAFAIFEGFALARDGIGDTLSETVWYLRDEGRWLYWLILDVIVVNALTMAWLLFHLRYQSGRTP